jgi:hypothetical protein
MECSLPLCIGSKVTIKNYNTFLHNYGSSGYKFWFQLSDDNKTGEVCIIDMASSVHENIAARLQNFFEVPNNGVVDDPLIVVAGQTRKRIYSSFLLLLNFQYSHNLFI